MNRNAHVGLMGYNDGHHLPVYSMEPIMFPSRLLTPAEKGY